MTDSRTASRAVTLATRRGLLAALLLFVTLAVGSATLIRPLQPADEALNADYAATLHDGRLPRVEEPSRPLLPGQRPIAPQFVANHPPGYYAIASVPLGAGIDADRPADGVLAARLLTVVLTAPVVLLVAALARVLTRGRRPDLVLAAAGLTAAWWVLPLHAGLIHNDGPAAALAAGQLLLLTLLLRDGIRFRYAAGLVALSAAASVVRLSASTLIGLSVLALVTAGVLHPRTTRARSAAVGVLWSLALLGAAAATSGWWWARNIRLYGDASATPLIVQMLGWEPDERSLVGIAADPLVWVWMAWGAGGSRHALTLILVLAWCAAVAVIAGRAAARQRRSGDSGWSPTALAIALLFFLTVGATLGQIVLHVQHGGGAHPRYLLPAMAVLVVGIAASLAPLRRGWIAFAALAAVQVASAGNWVAKFLTVDDAWTASKALAGLAFLATALAAVAVIARAMRTCRPEPEATPLPAPARAPRELVRG